MTTPVLLVFLFGAVAAALDARYTLIAASAYSALRAVFPSAAAAKIKSLRLQIQTAKKVVNSISAQDEFAKWAKEKRKIDKLENELAKAVKDIGSDKSAFERTVSWGVWIAVWVLHMGIVLSYRRTPMFYVPHGFVGPFSRMLSLPFAPAGSVSVAFWLFASKNVIKKLASATESVIASFSSSTTPVAQKKTVKTE